MLGQRVSENASNIRISTCSLSQLHDYVRLKKLKQWHQGIFYLLLPKDLNMLNSRAPSETWLTADQNCVQIFSNKMRIHFL